MERNSSSIGWSIFQQAMFRKNPGVCKPLFPFRGWAGNISGPDILRFPQWKFSSRYPSWLDHEWLSSHAGGQKSFWRQIRSVDVGHMRWRRHRKNMYITWNPNNHCYHYGMVSSFHDVFVSGGSCAMFNHVQVPIYFLLIHISPIEEVQVHLGYS